MSRKSEAAKTKHLRKARGTGARATSGESLVPKGTESSTALGHRKAPFLLREKGTYFLAAPIGRTSATPGFILARRIRAALTTPPRPPVRILDPVTGKLIALVDPVTRVRTPVR